MPVTLLIGIFQQCYMKLLKTFSCLLLKYCNNVITLRNSVHVLQAKTEVKKNFKAIRELPCSCKRFGPCQHCMEVLLKKMKPTDFIHPEDAAAIKQLENIPGFSTLLKKFYAIGLEKFQYGINMASNIRLSETQLPNLYKHLPPICGTLGIPVPEFYIQMNPMPNAFTFGDTRVFITVTSGLVEQLTDEELDTVLAHECGHILCRHVIYHSLAQYIVKYADKLGLIGDLATPLIYALLYWQRKSELSCDRAGAIITSPEIVSKVMVRLSGGPKNITSNVNIEEWAKQADQYETIRNDGIVNKAMQVYATMGLNHPFAAVRVREILKWGKTPAYNNIKLRLSAPAEGKCPCCLKPVEPNWLFCRHCGNKLTK